MADQDAVRIRRLRLRASEAERRAALTELEQAGWPDGGRDWILVRRIHVCAPRSRLGLRASASARRAIAAAVPAGAPGAAEAQAIRFTSQSELLAYLGADLLAGVARQRWYWRSWETLLSLPPVAAATRLWSEHIDHLAAITAVLAGQGHLAAIWPQLGESSARHLLARLAEHAGVAAVAGPAARAGEAPYAGDLPQGILRRWQAPLRGLPRAHPGARLAAVLILLEARPTALTTAPEAAIQAVMAQLEVPVPSPSPAPAGEGTGRGQHEHRSLPPSPPPRGGWQAGAPSAQPQPTGNGQPRAPDSAGRPGHDQGVRAGAARTDTEPPSASPPRSARWQPDQRPEGGHGDRAARADWREASDFGHRAGAVWPPPQGELVSAWAGTLYLINALHHPMAQRVVHDSGGWDTLPGGWPWLYRLGRALGLDTDDPLVAFMASQLGLERAADLEALLPPLPGRGRLLAVLARAYGELWDPALIGVPGRIGYTPSHVDAYLPMSHVRVAVRAAGLDINPGWVPWLGRVVTFHYQDAGAAP